MLYVSANQDLALLREQTTENQPSTEPAPEAAKTLADVPSSQPSFGTLTKSPSSGHDISDSRHLSEQSENVPKTQGLVLNTPSGYLTVKDFIKHTGMKKTAVYDLIKKDQGFPYRNIGTKKKYVIDLERYEKWSAERTRTERLKSSSIPTTEELMNIAKENSK